MFQHGCEAGICPHAIHSENADQLAGSDGKGYPEGLSNGDIPLAAKIVAIADTYHALISDRPYRRGMDIQKAISILEEGAGTQWDADLIRTFISIAPSLGV